MSDRRDDTEIGGAERAFPSTLWTLVLRARDASPAARREALGRLFSLYWKPVYCFIRCRGNDAEASKDLTQGFFATLLERDFLGHVGPDAGRFRTFLLTSASNFLADERERASALKRGGGRRAIGLDFADAEAQLAGLPTSTETPERIFTREWALRVLSRALEALRQEYATAGRSGEFEAFRRYMTLGDRKELTYADVAAQLGVTEGDVRNQLHALRARFRQALMALVRDYTDTEEDAREELREIVAALS